MSENWIKKLWLFSAQLATGNCQLTKFETLHFAPWCLTNLTCIMNMIFFFSFLITAAILRMHRRKFPHRQTLIYQNHGIFFVFSFFLFFAFFFSADVLFVDEESLIIPKCAWRLQNLQFQKWFLCRSFFLFFFIAHFAIEQSW